MSDERNGDAVSAERDAVSDERDAVSDERDGDAASDERDAVSDERDGHTVSDEHDGDTLNDAPEKKRRGGFFLNVVPAALYVMAVFYGGAMRGSAVPLAEFRWGDKALHALAFAGMQIAMLRAVRFGAPELSPAKQRLLSLALVVAVGGLLELYQLGLPHRSAELADWLADTVGAALVFAVQGGVARRGDPAASQQS
ncbi:MAG: VanZ family protein [Myxococcales bacterium]|nr:VanZ family protein [Myxococcales bacterium]